MWRSVLRIRIRDPVPFWPLDPGSRIPDLRSRIPKPYFWELIDNIFGKKFYNSLKISQNFFFSISKIKWFTILWNLWLQKKGITTNFFLHPSLLLLILEQGSGIRDPGWVKIRIRDKHHGHCTKNNYDLTIKSCNFSIKKNWRNYLGRDRRVTLDTRADPFSKIRLTTLNCQRKATFVMPKMLQFFVTVKI